jgi:hypothetical protein
VPACSKFTRRHRGQVKVEDLLRSFNGHSLIVRTCGDPAQERVMILEMETVVALLAAVGLLVFWLTVYGGVAAGTYKVAKTAQKRRRERQALEPDESAIKAIRGKDYRNAVDELNKQSHEGALRQLPHNYGWRPTDRMPRRPPDHGGKNLAGARLHFADLSGQEILEAYLSRTIFRESTLRKTNFKWSYLSGADFTNADCQGADFSETDCTGAVFAGANLRRANFHKAILRGTNFDGANLTDAVLTTPTWEEARFTYKAVLRGARLPDGSKHEKYEPRTERRGRSKRKTKGVDDDQTMAHIGEGQGDWYEVGDNHDSGQGDYS